MIYVIRHGQTDLNKERKMQGRMGLPLNEYGILQANILKGTLNHIEFDIILSSPQERAVQTAEIVSGRRAIVDNRLDVFDLGEADRLYVHEVKLKGALPDPAIYKGTEDPTKFVERIFRFMSELETLYRHQQKTILIAGHKCTTGCIGAYFEGFPSDGNVSRYSVNTGEYKHYNFS